MGLNLSFIEDDAYNAIALCSTEKASIVRYTLVLDRGAALPAALVGVPCDSRAGRDDKYDMYDFKAADLAAEHVEALHSVSRHGEEAVEGDGRPWLWTQSAWEARDYRESMESVCANCPIGRVDENFRRCYPRMGSYSFVASLADFFESKPDNPRYAEMATELFVEATEPGGYRIGEEHDEDLYRRHLASIARVRAFLADETAEAALCYFKGEPVSDSYYVAKPPIDSIGNPSSFSGGQGVRWGVHQGLGIALIRDDHRSTVNYFQAIRSGEGDAIEVVDAGGAVQVIHDPMGPLKPTAEHAWGDESPYDELRMGKVPALDRLSHILDTAEAALTLALEHALTVHEC